MRGLRCGRWLLLNRGAGDRLNLTPDRLLFVGVKRGLDDNPGGFGASKGPLPAHMVRDAVARQHAAHVCRGVGISAHYVHTLSATQNAHQPRSVGTPMHIAAGRVPRMAQYSPDRCRIGAALRTAAHFMLYALRAGASWMMSLQRASNAWKRCMSRPARKRGV